MADCCRLAVWSGPRNISTALMRSWGNRTDTWVIDEPFYAHYLQQTGIQHPGRQEILQSQSSDWQAVKDHLLHAAQPGRRIYYQKHMAHHYLPSMRGEWVLQLTNVFLLRDPAAMLKSLDKVTPNPGVMDTGLPQQLELFQQVQEATGKNPLVIDSAAILRQPEIALRAWCEQLQIEFQTSMLHWPEGARDSDGVWAKYWYDSVNRSTGFLPFDPLEIDLPGHLQATFEECLPYYQQLQKFQLKV